MKCLVYGTDQRSEQLMRDCFHDGRTARKHGIYGFISDKRSMDTFFGMPVYEPRDLSGLDYDKIILTQAGNGKVQHDMFVYGYHVPSEKIELSYELLKLRILSQPREGMDEETLRTLEHVENTKGINMWCGYCPEPGKLYPVQWDELHNMPFIFYAGKRMYYPRTTEFIIHNGKQYFYALDEQQPGSPHTYINEDVNIKEGDVLVDAGVCEGNFAIKYIDIVSKVYLIECDPQWIDPLMLTFQDYLDKVVLCDKCLGGVDDDQTITLDTLVGDGKVDFIKMDIEGAERDALRGGKKVFQGNDIKCSICSYHKHGDEEAIKEILASYGYDTGTSPGHAIYFVDDEIYKYPELRKAIVYGFHKKK